ncbi:MAG: hypothetical protein HGB01_11470 [Chlorobiaceae bacterium]|nr:hypothetical protein [Chlorobiaceae bacterium]
MDIAELCHSLRWSWEKRIEDEEAKQALGGPGEEKKPWAFPGSPNPGSTNSGSAERLFGTGAIRLQQCVL